MPYSIFEQGTEVITVGILVKIRQMNFHEKIPLREITRRAGLLRNTVHNWLRPTDAVEPKYPKHVGSSVADEGVTKLTTWLQADTDERCNARA